MSVVNGKIIAPVSMTDIAQVLGDSTEMAKSEKINEWSARKPIRHKSRSRLSDAEMAANNYGFNIGGISGNNNATAVFDTDPNAALTKAINANGKWEYLRPRGSSYNEHERMCDFDGYNHNAPPPYTTIIPQTTNKPNPVLDIWESTNCEIPVEKLSGTIFANDISSYRVALLWRKRGQTSGIGYEVSTQTVGNSLATGATLRMYPNFPSAGAYDVVFAVTEFDPAYPYEDDKAWVYLPNTYKVVNYNPNSGTVNLTLYHDQNNGFVVNYVNGNEVNTVSMRFYVNLIDVNYTPEAMIYAELTTADGDLLATSSKFSGEIDDNGYMLGGTLTITNPRWDALYANEVYIRVYYEFKEFDSSETPTTMYIDLVRNTASREYVKPVTIQSVLNSI